MKFEELIFVDYPIPQEFSIWSESKDADGEVIPPLYDIKNLVISCVKDLASDLFISDTIRVSCQNTPMPEGTIGIQYVTLDFKFPGNKRIKYSYLKGTNMLNVIYTPCYVTFRRKLKPEDLDNLEGDRLRYFKSYFLYKMTLQELNILKSTDLHTDNASINLDVLDKFAESKKLEFEELKKEILIYAGKF